MRQHDAIDNSDWYQLCAEKTERQLELRVEPLIWRWTMVKRTVSGRV